MSWVPGWDSAESAAWWSTAWFWASIASLLMLGVCEVVSHRYSQRKDELTETHQRELQRTNAKDIAGLQLQAAQANERAATAQLALEQYKAPRSISDAAVHEMRSRLEPFSGMHVEIFVTSQTNEVNNLQARIVEILRESGWSAQSWALMGGIAATGAVVIVRPGADRRAVDAAQALVTSLNEAGVPSASSAVPAWWQASWGALPGLSNGPPWSTSGNHADVRLLIGTKD